jgi:hypothetical protein
LRIQKTGKVTNEYGKPRNAIPLEDMAWRLASVLQGLDLESDLTGSLMN